MPRADFYTTPRNVLDDRYVNVTGDTMTGLLTMSDTGITISTTAGNETSPLKFDPATATAINVYQRAGSLTIGTGSGTTNRAVSIAYAGGSGGLAMHGAAPTFYPITNKTGSVGKDSLYWGTTYTEKLYLNSTAILDGSSAGLVKLDGNLLVEPSTDSTTAFQVTQADATVVLNVDTTNARVGIGTTNPNSPLNVYSNSEIQAIFNGWDSIGGAQVYNGSIAIGNNSAYQGIIHYNGNGVSDLYIDNTYDSAVLGGIYFRTRTAGTPVNAMSILSSGNIGIGTAAPGAKLEVNGAILSSGTSKLQLRATSGDRFEMFYDVGAEAIDLIAYQDNDTERGGITLFNPNNAQTSLAFYTGTARNERMRIQSDGDVIMIGNVGIGVTDPDTKVEILHAGNQLKLSFDATDNATFAVDTNGDLTISPSGSNFIIPDAKNFTFNATTGTKLGTATSQKIGFYNATPVVQQAYTAISDPPTQAQVTAIRDVLVNLGFMATS